MVGFAADDDDDDVEELEVGDLWLLLAACCLRSPGLKEVPVERLRQLESMALFFRAL